MPLRSELKELLAGFENRMKFINIVRCLLDYPYKDSVRSMIPEKEILDNIIMAVLVYIKDRTLGSEQTCTIEDIEQFLDDFSVVLPEYTLDTKALARFIIVDVLQNGGKMTAYLTFHSKSETFDPMNIRLINEEKGHYHLSDDAFDFLFRSKEIESELDYSVTRFRMKEYMKRNNYSEALDASRELVSRIRNMKVSMDDFLLRCREDITKVTVDRYDSVIGRIRTLLDEEYKELEEIRQNARERSASLENAGQSGMKTEELKKNRVALAEIIQNIDLTIDEQRGLINKRSSLSEDYRQLIADSFVVNRFERMNFDRDILSPMRHAGSQLGYSAKFLLFMLTKPQLAHQFSIESFYAPQRRISEEEKQRGMEIDSEENGIEELLKDRFERFLRITTRLFSFMQGKNVFPISDFVYSLSLSDLSDFCEENALPHVLLTLFGLQELDIDDWKHAERLPYKTTGEFELGACLEQMSEGLLEISRVRFAGLDTSFSFFAERSGQARVSFDMSDYRVEVEVTR